MGKPFQSELAQLPQTYLWASEFPVDSLAKAIRRSKVPLLTVGSGGSFTTACLAVALHEHHFGLPAVPMTPLEVANSDIDLRATAVLLFTAGGKNPDILGAFYSVVRREPVRLTIICARTGSKLAAAAAKHSTVELSEFDPPAGRDGFLATNSLLASCLLLVRGYASAAGVAHHLPKSLESLVGPQFRKIDFSPLLTKETIVVLYPPSLRTVAVEIESKFTEAALGHVQTADYRQFAHGRHHWLAKRGLDTAVLALCACAEDIIAMRTLRLLPDAIPTVRLDLPHSGPVACLAGVAHAFELVRQAGEIRRIDPGDPGVPKFGRRLYNLSVFPRVPPNGLIADAEYAIGRKARSPSSCTSATIWEDAYRRFLATLGSARIRAVVLDYDGTLCDEAKRFDSLPRDVVKQLIRILRAGIPIGVATGRGKSVQEQLQEALPRDLWKQVVVGYYNGGDIGLLTEDRPDGTKVVSEPLRAVEELLSRHRPFLGPCETELRLPQITLKPADSMPLDRLWQCAQGLVSHLAGVKVVRSGHSIDILAPGVSKLTVVRRAAEMAGCAPDDVLCVGDQGCWPGNDHELLGTRLSLSANVTSADPDCCWNLAPPGSRESQATLGYLSLLKKSRGYLRIDLTAKARKPT